MATIHALFVAVENAAPAPTLKGCINDVQKVEQLIELHKGDKNVAVTRLLNQEATKQNIVQAFTGISQQVQPDDTFLFYFSGHGAQESLLYSALAETENGCLQGIVCFDSLQADGSMLVNREIRYLMQALPPTAHKLMIIDACYSGDATRYETIVKAATPKLLPARQWSQFVFAEKHPEGSILNKDDFDRKVPLTPHLVLTACQPTQTAKLWSGKGSLFTILLTETLRNAGAQISYTALCDNISQRLGLSQIPVVKAENGNANNDMQQLFMGGLMPPPPISLPISWQNTEWRLPKGALDGIQANHLSISLQNMPDYSVILKHIQPSFTVLEIIDADKQVVQGQLLDKYDAIVEGFYPATLQVYIADNTSIIMDKKAFWAKAKMPAALQWATNPALADLILSIKKEGSLKSFAWINAENWQTVEQMPVTRPITTADFGDAQIPDELSKQLERINRWNYLKNIENPISQIPNNAIDIQIEGLRYENGVFWGELPTDFTTKIQFFIQIQNKTNLNLHIGSLELSPLYGITPHSLPETALPSGNSLRFSSSEIANRPYIIDFKLPFVSFFIKIINSTSPLNMSSLKQHELAPPEKKKPTMRSEAVLSTPVMERMDDWNTQIYEIRLINKSIF